MQFLYDYFESKLGAGNQQLTCCYILGFSVKASMCVGKCRLVGKTGKSWYLIIMEKLFLRSRGETNGTNRGTSGLQRDSIKCTQRPLKP